MLYQEKPENERLASVDSAASPIPTGEKNTLTCPICEAKFTRGGNSNTPFCSTRCRQVDLGRWLNESYGLPYEGEDRPFLEEDSSEDEL